jgi:hypothetical protein
MYKPTKRKYFLIIIISICFVCCCRFSMIENSMIDSNLITSTSTSKQSISTMGTPTPLIQATFDFIDHKGECSDYFENDLGEFNLNGTIVFNKELDLTVSNLVFLNTKNNIKKVFENIRVFNLTVSPQGNYFAYGKYNFDGEKTKDYEINITNNVGEIIYKTDYVDYMLGFDWLNENNLLINYTIEGYPIILYSPANGEQQILESFKSDSAVFIYDEIIRGWGIYSYNKNVYNPSLTRILYPSSGNDGPKVILRDIIEKKDLAVFPTNATWGVSPSWSHNGEELAIGINTNENARNDGKEEFELFVINNNGDIIYKTNLQKGTEGINISYLNWSPNDKYIAFLYSTSENGFEQLKLSTLYLESQKTNTYCISPTAGYEPKWSLDSKYILIGKENVKSGEIDSYIIDVSTGQYAILKE